MKLLSILTVFVLSSLFTANSQDDYAWNVDYENSQVGFKATEQGKEFSGKFEAFTAQVSLNPEDVSNAQISAEVTLKGVEAGSKDRNETLPGKEWFHIKKYPTATFTSSSVEKLEDGSFLAKGDLTIKGISKPADLRFTLVVEGNQATAEGGIELSRMDYKVGTGSYADKNWIAHNVEVTLLIQATK